MAPPLARESPFSGGGATEYLGIMAGLAAKARSAWTIASKLPKT